MREFDQKNHFFFEVSSCFKVNCLRLTLGMAVKFYTSVEKGLKLKVRKCWDLPPTFEEVTGEKLANIRKNVIQNLEVHIDIMC